MTYLLRPGAPNAGTQERSVNVTLEVATLAETVTVTGESPVVDVQNATVGVNFSTVHLSNLRFQKQFKVSDRNKIDAMFDLFNIFNANTVLGAEILSTTTTDRNRKTVPRFGRAQSILNPRIFRLGIRYSF